MSLTAIVICVIVGGVNLVTFVLFAIDKRCAIKSNRRISERRLLTLSAFGGALGAILSMRLFRHKTQKLKFKLLVPLFLIIQIAIVLYLMSDKL